MRKSEPSNPIAELSARLTPAGRRALGKAPGDLKPEGNDIARRFLQPLADTGPLTRDQVRAGIERARTTERARVDALMRNRVSLLGGYEPQDLGDPIDWFRAPQGDWQWPTHLSRHYWLLPVAYAYRATGDAAYARKVVAVLREWVAKTPIGSPALDNKAGSWSRRYAEGQTEPVTREGTFKGYNDGPWTALSAHARLDYWSQLFQLVGDAPALTNQAAAVLLNSLLGDHRQIMLDFPRQMNQYQAIASSLVEIGLYYPQFVGAAAAERVGWERLTRHTLREVYPDGSLAECSPNYGAGMMERLLRIVGEGEARGRAVPALLKDRVAKAARYFARIADPLGRSPRIAKGGGSVLPLLTTLNAAARDPEVAFVASRGREGRAPASPNASFPWAGHHVFRSGWDEKATWLFFDAGPRGSGHHDIAQLGVQLFANGEWLLTDTGYYSYSGEGEPGRMAAYLKTTAAHNAALVDGQGQISVAPGASQGPNEKPGDYGWSETEAGARAEGRYTYGFGPGGAIQVAHQRRVTFERAAGTFVIEDTFTGGGRHRIDLHWQMDPAARVTPGPNAVTVERERTRLEMTFATERPLRIAPFKGHRDPLRGWFSATYGKLEAAPLAQVTAEGPLPMTITTRLRIVTG